MDEPFRKSKTHTDLILLGVFSLWWHVLGLGFLVLWLVRNRLKALTSQADRAEVRSLQTARALGQVSVLLFVMSLIGIVFMVTGHNEKSRRNHIGRNHHEPSAANDAV